MKQKIGFICLAFYILLMGVGSLIALAPFEGHDEIGHYSMIRQVAAEGHYPVRGKAFIDEHVRDYIKLGPIPYLVASPYTADDGKNYPIFFSDPERVERFARYIRGPDSAGAFKPSELANWQIQHPPFYYVMMAPLASLFANEPVATQFFVLRLASFLVAMAGFFLALYGTLRYAAPDSRKVILLTVLLYPVIFPQFFPEFARIGNDSLCLLIMGAFWCAFLKWYQEPFDRHLSLLIGALLCIGLLTKGLFLPILGAFGVAHLIRSVQMRHTVQSVKPYMLSLALIGLPVLFALLWYFVQWKSSGAMIGHLEYKYVARKGGVIAAFLSKANGDVLFNGVGGLLLSWSWAGYASSGRFVEVYQFPVFLMAVWLVARSIRALRRQPVEKTAWFPIVMVLFMLAGLLHHLVVMIGLDGSGGTPAWYLHILAVPVAYFLSFGVRDVLRFRIGRGLFWGLTLYAIGFFLIALWAQMALSSACVGLGTGKIYDFEKASLCFDRFGLVFHRLMLLARPDIGGVLMALAVFVLLSGLFLCRKVGQATGGQEMTRTVRLGLAKRT